MNDYYQTLGVPKTATRDEIKQAYRKLAHQYHPDKQEGDEKKFKEINEAYQVLGNEQKRTQYDQSGPAFGSQGNGDFSGFQGFDFNNFSGRGFQSQEFDLGDIFSEFFGGRTHTATKTRQRGKDIKIDMIISLEEAASGVERDILLKKYIKCDKCSGNKNEPGTQFKSCETCNGSGEIHQTQRTILGSFARITVCKDCEGEGKFPEKKCTKCHGMGRIQDTEKIHIKVPAGINSEEIITLQGKGEAGEGEYGNLFVEVHIKEHLQFERDGDDIYSKVEIQLSQAVLGDSISIKTLQGVVSVKIPDGIDSGAMIKLHRKGMPHLHGGGCGDHYVKIIVKTPKKLSKHAKQLFEELRKEEL